MNIHLNWADSLTTTLTITKHLLHIFESFNNVFIEIVSHHYLVMHRLNVKHCIVCIYFHDHSKSIDGVSLFLSLSLSLSLSFSLSLSISLSLSLPRGYQRSSSGSAPDTSRSSKTFSDLWVILTCINYERTGLLKNDHQQKNSHRICLIIFTIRPSLGCRVYIAVCDFFFIT